VKWFDYAAPQTVDDALQLAAQNAGALPLAGGTDLLVQMRAGRKTPPFVIDIKRIPELNELKFNEATGLTLGAATPCYLIAKHADVRKYYPALAEVASMIGGTQIQGRASIGGNLCNAAPSADSIPLLIAMIAQCVIAGPSGRRTVAVENFCTAPGQSILGTNEILVSLQIPTPAPNSGACYLRFIPRNEMDIAVVGVGVSITIDAGVIQAARVALASVAPTPLFVPEAGQSLIGKAPSDEAFTAAAAIARDAAKPISDMRGTAKYRSHLCEVLTRRALSQAKGGK